MARTQADRKEWPAAAVTLDRLLNDFPASRYRREARFFRAEAALQADDAKAAEEAFAALLADPAAPTDPPGFALALRRERVQALLALKRWKDVVETAEAFKKDAPADPLLPEIDYARGRALQSLSPPRFDEARTAYQDVIDARKGGDLAARAQLMRGETFFHQKNYTEAKREFFMVVTVYDAPPWQAAALLEAGKVYERLNEWPDAAATYQELLAKFPQEPSAAEAKARLEATGKTHRRASRHRPTRRRIDRGGRAKAAWRIRPNCFTKGSVPARRSSARRDAMTGLNLESFLHLLRADLGAWVSLGLIVVVLALMTWTSWGSRRALRKCLALSIIAHVGLVLYGSTIPIVLLALDPQGKNDVPRDRIQQIRVAPWSETDPSGHRDEPGSGKGRTEAFDRPRATLALAETKVTAPPPDIPIPTPVRPQDAEPTPETATPDLPALTPPEPAKRPDDTPTLEPAQVAPSDPNDIAAAVPNRAEPVPEARPLPESNAHGSAADAGSTDPQRREPPTLPILTAPTLTEQLENRPDKAHALPAEPGPMGLAGSPGSEVVRARDRPGRTDQSGPSPAGRQPSRARPASAAGE